MATATATLTHGDALALLAAAMCAAQEQATEGDGEPGGAEMEIKALAELAGDPEALMKLLGGGGAAVAESVRPKPEPQTRRVKTIQRDPLTGFITGIVDTVELVESVAPGLLESAPGPPPRPGLVFDESSHRWTRPDKGDPQSSDKPEKAAPAKAAPHQSAAPTKASAAARRKPGDSFHDGMTGTLAKLKAGEIDPGDVEDAVGKLAQDYADAIAAHAEGFADHGVESMDSTFGSAITEHPESEAAISDFRYACESAADYIVAEANRLQDAAKTIADAHWEEDADMIAEAEAGFAAASERFQSAREAYRGRLKDAADELSRNLNNAVDAIAAPAVEVADELNSDTYGGPDDPDAAADAAKANAELEAAGNPFRVYLEPESGEWTYAVPDEGELSESAPGPPPRPGLVFDESSHRWVRPESPKQKESPASSGASKPGGAGKAAKVKSSPAKRTKEQQPKSEKVARAKAAHKMVDKTIQRYSEEHNEPQFAKAMGGVSFPNGEPVDVAIPGADGQVKDGVELKTMTIGGNDKLTMNAYAQVRKIEWEREQKAAFHTVVIDDREVFNAKGEGQHDESKRVYYYRRGVAGSARIGSMHKAASLDEIKKLMAMPPDQLPPGARRTEQDWLTAGRWKFFADDEGKGYKNTKTGQVVRPKK